MGDEREIPKPDTQYMGVDHKQLKKWTDEGQPGDADELAQTWQKMGMGLTGAATNLMAAVFGSEAGWTGQAADAMRAQLKKVAEWSQQTGESFNQAGAAFVQQGESVGNAKTAMPDPVEYDPGKMIKDAASSGNPVRIAMLPWDMHQQAEASKEAHAQAASVVAARDAQLAAAAQSIPPFEAPPTLPGSGGEKVGIEEPGIPDGRGIPGGGGPGGGGGGGIPGGGSPGGGGGGHGGGTGPSGNAIIPGNNPGLNPPRPNLPVGSGTDTSGFAPGTPPGFTQTGPGNGNFPGSGPGGGGGLGGPGGGFGGPGGFGGGGFGPGGSRPGAGFGPTGQGAGASASGGAGAGGAGRGAATGRGGSGMGGGQKGEGGEDSEHQRPSYLVEPDPDAMFGTDQMTAPPVIGG
jgi:hypothetical protein